MSERRRRGYCSKCGGRLTEGKPCAGGSKVLKPLEVEARSVATGFVLSRKDQFANVTQGEIDAAISKVSRVLYDLMAHP